MVLSTKLTENKVDELYNQIAYTTNKTDLLQNFLYYGHNGFLSSLYNDFNKNKYKITDFGIKDIKLLGRVFYSIKVRNSTRDKRKRRRQQKD